MYRRNCEIKPGVEFPQGMHRIALGVEYNGAPFSGFQKQAATANTVQSLLEAAISKVADECVGLVCAGRTDAGVHASGQVIHFDTLARRPQDAWVKGVNASLPDDVRVHWCRPVSAAFHSRFCATARIYRYIILSGKTRPGLMHKLLTWTAYPLAVDKMREAGASLVGEHDFSSFRSSQCQARSAVRSVHSLQFCRRGPFIIMEIKANAFLHHMVRNIVGTMIDIGRGAKPVQWMMELLHLRDRTQASATARPWGLYLVKVEYDGQFNLPDMPLGPLFLQAAAS